MQKKIETFQPDDAEPQPTEPTPTEFPPTIECSFESDFGIFEVTGVPSFNFTRVQVKQSSLSDLTLNQGGSMTEGEGPTEDATGSRWVSSWTIHTQGVFH